MPAKKSSSEKPVNLSQLQSELQFFFKKTLEPRFQFLDQETQTTKLDQKRIRDILIEFRGETLSRFDDLYKKFEDLRQEYLVVKHQMKRFDTCDETMLKNLNDLQTKVTQLQTEIEAFKQRIPSQ